MKKWGIVMKNEIIKFSDFSKIVLKDSEGLVVGHAIVDNDDVDEVMKHKWHLTNTGYVIGYSDEDQTKFLLHNFIKKPKDGFIVDHINRNRTDCRRENLRYLTQSHNVLTAKLSRRNTSGKKGVYIFKDKNGNVKYKASIQVNRKVHYLGVYNTFTDAVNARQKAELELVGFILDN